MRRQILAMLGTVLALAAMASPATALAGNPAGTCAGGIITSNTYSSFTVTGNCMFAPGAVVRINGNLTVADGAMLNDHAASAAEVHITGNVRVGRGAVLGLGTYATPGRVGPDTVGGSIVANQPRTLYLGSMTVGGSVISIGGGLASTSAADFRNFPIKDNVIHGSLVILGWRGGWIGVIRNHVGGSVHLHGQREPVVWRRAGAGPGFERGPDERHRPQPGLLRQRPRRAGQPRRRRATQRGWRDGDRPVRRARGIGRKRPRGVNAFTP